VSGLTRQQKLEMRLAEIAKQPDFPAFSHHIQEVMRAIEDEAASLRRLTDMVLRDFSLTLRVLRAANSVCVNRSGRPVVSVAHAVALLGTESIRDLAGSVALFEHYRGVSPGLKELMLLSLLTANQTQTISERIEYPRPEEAYICGMFRNLGEVLVACYLPRKYVHIISEMNERSLPEREVCLQALEFTYEDLAQAMAKHWNLPDPVSRCMAPPEPVRLAGAYAEGSLLHSAVAFSHTLTTVVYRRDPESASARVNMLLQDYFPVLGLTQEDVSHAVERAISDTRTTFAALNTPLDVLRLRTQAEMAIAQIEAAPPGEEEEISAAEIAEGEELLRQLVHQVETEIASPEFQLQKVVLMTLEALYRGGRFDRALFCLTDRDHTTMLGRLGLGEGADALRQKFKAPISVRGGLVGAALVRRQDLFIPEGGSYAQSEALRTMGAASLGVYPILADGVLGGCLYFDRLTAKPTPSPRVLEMISHLRDLLTQAIVQSRGALSEKAAI
jgi:HD-like signal output (HDOD) protein